MDESKSFDVWNTNKKEIHQKQNLKRYHQGDIWWCKLGKNIGFEQNGTGSDFDRPVLVIRGFNKKVCLIVPFTTKGKENKFYYNVGLIENKNAFAILSQVRLIDTKRLENKIGYININKLYEIKKAIWSLIR